MRSATEALRPYVRTVVERGRRLRRLPHDHHAYLEHRRRHRELLRADADAAPDPALLAAVVDDGVVVVRGFVPRDEALRMAAEVRPTMEAIAADRYAGPLRSRRDEAEGLHRLFGADDELAPSTRAFFADRFLAGTADALAAPGTHVADAYVDYKDKVGGHDVSVDFHVDHWKLRFKAFLLLSDVTVEQAPMVYLAGSHRTVDGDERFRRRCDWAYQRHGTAHSVLGPRRVARLRDRHGFEERVLTGQAGDLVLADTRGIHRGSELQRGTRLQLVTLFVMNGPPEHAC